MISEYPFISIVIITQNEEKNIKDCLDSIMAIDYPKERYEIIIVDSSSDKTAEIANKYSVKILKTSPNNFAFSRNIGINEAKGEFVAFTDADCIVPRDWLKTLVKNFDSNTAGVGGNAFPPKNSTYFGKCVASLGFPAGGSIGLDSLVKKIDSGVSALSTCNAIFKKDVICKIGGFNEKLNYGGEDFDLSRRLRSKGYILKYEPKSYVYHKPRETIAEFLKWNYRRGKAKYKYNKLNSLFVFLNPFSITWIGFLFFLSLVNIRYSLFFILCIWLFTILVMFLGTKRYRMLISRRKKSGIDLPSIFITVAFLFYLRQMFLNLGQMREMLSK